MIVVEIKKNGQLYTFHLNSFKDIHTAYEYANEVATGKNYFEDSSTIVDLGTSEEYEHIRVWEEKQIEITNDVVEPEGYLAKGLHVSTVNAVFSYLGQKLSVKVARGFLLDHDGAFLLAYEINNQPAMTIVSKDNLENIVIQAGYALGYGEATAIIQHADLLTEEAAIEYVEDYLKELQKETAGDMKDKTATAYFGFNKDED